MKKELMDAIDNGTLYDFICCDGWKIDKDDLITIVKECYYAGMSLALKYDDKTLFKSELKENLKECFIDDESEEI